ncbi:MAG TPA: ArsR family transcriptional regulator [Candidatus Andersenbacteria bacterium]|nr:ArsR family transcriptional regulator [Candidatus Andersenbacteria bacterium]
MKPITATKTKTDDTNKNINHVLADPVRVNIMEALRGSELTLQELADMLHAEKRLLLYHLRTLIQAGAVTEYTRRHHTSYGIANRPVSDTSHLLYELWAEEIGRHESHARLSL